MMKLRAFSLVEMLVAMAVFSAVAVLMASILSNVAGSGKRDENRVAAFSAFRTAADRITTDWNASVPGASHGPQFQKRVGNDEMRFFAHVRPPRTTGTQPRLARVGYRVAPGEALMRDVEPVEWDDLMSTAAPSAGAIPFEEICGAGIFRMEMAFQDRQGNLRADPPTSSSDIKAVVVAFAALDPELMERLSQTQREELEALLPDVVNGGVPGENWNPELLDSTAAYVQSGVRFYQRWFPFQ